MLNKAILIGRLTRDPEVRYTASGNATCSFTLAVERSFANQAGEREVDFIPVVTWRKLAETCGKHLAKGRLVAVSGRIQVRTYEDKNGQRRYVTEVVADEVQFLERKQENTSTSSAGGYAQDMEPVDDDELPF